MKNMDPKSSQWLDSLGIHTLDDVARLGVVETYKRLKAAYPDKVTLNMLWGLQAALLDLPWSDLQLDIKEELRKQVEEA
jgi:DNA transformation protein